MRSQLRKNLTDITGSTSSCGIVTCCQECQSRATLQVMPPGNEEELLILRREIETLQAELRIANTRLQESERHLQER